MLVTDEYIRVLNQYDEAKDSEEWDEALHIAALYLPHKLNEVVDRKLERFLNPEIKKTYALEVEDYEEALKLCKAFMPEKIHAVALEFYNYFRIEKKWNDDALDVAREYLPDKLEEAVTTRFKELMREKEEYYDALVLKDEFPNLINHDINRLAILAYKELLKDYRYYSQKLSKNEFLKEHDINYQYKIQTLQELNAVSQNVGVDTHIIYEKNGVKICYPLNLELRIEKIDKIYNKSQKKNIISA
jgi:hypothetical protein